MIEIDLLKKFIAIDSIIRYILILNLYLIVLIKN